MFKKSAARLLITGSTPAELAKNAGLPNADTYRSMSVKDLLNLVETREGQIRDVRKVYEGMFYNIEQHLRRQMLDHDDQRHSLDKIHCKVIDQAKTLNLATIKAMRKNEDSRDRDKRAVTILCFFSSVFFFLWLRKHYINNYETIDASSSFVRGYRTTERDYFFRSTKWSGRSRETDFDKELRERQEAAAAAGAAPPPTS